MARIVHMSLCCIVVKASQVFQSCTVTELILVLKRQGKQGKERHVSHYGLNVTWLLIVLAEIACMTRWKFRFQANKAK